MKRFDLEGKSMRKLGFLALLLGVAACESSSADDDNGTGPDPSGGASFSKYVAMGTSVSMGVASDGVFSTSQLSAWPRLLAQDAGVTFTLPLIDPPGCTPPFAAPLSSFKRIDNTPVTTTDVCSRNSVGVTLPTQNVAVSGATAADAVGTTGGAGGVTARVLAPSQTQLTAMRSQTPTFVSVELGSNEVLGGLTGLVATGTTITAFSQFSQNYQTVIDQVKASGAKALLVTGITDIRKFPAVRTSAEIAAQRTPFAALNVSVNADCNTSSNFITTPKISLAVATGIARVAAGQGPFDLSCADVPGAQDYVLTPADVSTMNSLLAQMNGFIVSKASENGYATFSLDALYATSKDGVPFNIAPMLTLNTPFGPNISLDSVHPSAAGQAILAAAAKAAIISKYGSITK
jgi:lysophospholipase L1-like esterase